MYGTMMVTQTSVTRGEEGEREGKEERLAHNYAANRSPLYNYLYSSAGHTPRISHDSSNAINTTAQIQLCTAYIHISCVRIREQTEGVKIC